MPTLAEFLRLEMERKHLSQSELARRIGVYPDYVRRWIAGDTPRPDRCAQIADGLGLPVSRVMQMAGYPMDTAVPAADQEKQQALEEFERILDEHPRGHWRGLMAITRGVADALAQDADVQRDPEEHAGNKDGRDNSHNSVVDRVYLAPLSEGERLRLLQLRDEAESMREPEAVTA